jgi:prevent-host-death family protein
LRLLTWVSPRRTWRPLHEQRNDGFIGIPPPDHRVAPTNMAIYNSNMAISVTKFKNSCLDVIRRVEATGQPVSITRRGKVVARLAPSFQATQIEDAKPWQQLRALGGELLAEPSESVVREEDFEALR